MKFTAWSLCLWAGGIGGVSSLSSANPPQQALAQLVAANHIPTTTSSGATIIITDEESTKQDLINICNDLYQQNKGFSANLVDGEWVNVLELPGKKSRRKESKATFAVDKQEIQIAATTPRGNGVIDSIVTYTPVGQGYSVDTKGRIILRRITFDREKSRLKYRFLPRIPIPFSKRKGGWVDFAYLDKNVQVTRDNHGGICVLMRSDFFDKLLLDQQ